MLNRERNRLFNLYLRTSSVIRKKNIEIRYRRVLQKIITRTNDALVKKNFRLEREAIGLKNEVFVANSLYNMVSNNNKLLTIEKMKCQSKIEELIRENQYYREALQKKDEEIISIIRHRPQSSSHQ